MVPPQTKRLSTMGKLQYLFLLSYVILVIIIFLTVHQNKTKTTSGSIDSSYNTSPSITPQNRRLNEWDEKFIVNNGNDPRTITLKDINNIPVAMEDNTIDRIKGRNDKQQKQQQRQKEQQERQKLQRHNEIPSGVTGAHIATKQVSSSTRAVVTPLRVCERMAPISHEEDMAIMHKYNSECTAASSNRPPNNTTLLLLEGTKTFGRTGNNLIEFLHALQYARDYGHVVGIMQGSWPQHMITDMWMAVQYEPDGNNKNLAERAKAVAEWTTYFEQVFCAKILRTYSDLDQYKEVIRMDTKDLFIFHHDYHVSSFDEYVEYQTHIIRTLFRSYNRGIGVNMRNEPVGNMCSVLDAMFGDEKYSAMYSVIHSRTLETAGEFLLGVIAEGSGCDPKAALDMTPEYIKAILEPIGLLELPILFITDHQRPEILEKLMADPDIGPKIHLVPDEASWVGGDMTVAMLSTVFIGNPASTFSGFIAKSRLALGYEHSYLFRKKDENGNWVDVCAPNCIFNKSVMHTMA